MNIDIERLAQIEALHLQYGSHSDFAYGMCAMEAVSYIAGEPWSDHPECACPIITSFMVTWGDGLPTDADRDRLLKPLVPLIVGTRLTKDVEQRRATMAADWLIRVHMPPWLRLAKLETQAAALEALPKTTDFAQLVAAGGGNRAAWAVAWAASAAWEAAARDSAAAVAAAVAAGDSATAWAAAAAVAAGDSAAAAAAAGAAAKDSAWAADWAALKPTMERLQDSAQQLVRRMIETT